MVLAGKIKGKMLKIILLLKELLKLIWAYL